MSRPVICQVLHSLNVGGAEILAANLARRLASSFHFIFACLDEMGTLGGQLQREGFEIEVFNRQPGIDWRCMKQLAELMSRRRIQLIHAHQYTPFFYSAASGLFRKRPAVLFTEHGRWHPDYPSRKRMLFNRTMLRKRDRVVGVGEDVRRALIDNEGLPPNRVGVIYNGIDLHGFGNVNGRDHVRAEVRRELGIAGSSVVAIQVARLDALKDHITAVQTMAQVVKTRPDIHLVMVGDGPEREAISSAIRENSLESSVHLLGTRSDISQLLESADIFLLTSISEGIPLTILEAMAAGLPVVSTSVGGVPEVVENQKTGLLCEPRDPIQLCNAILRLTNDEPRRHVMGAAGQRRVHDLFSDERMNASYTQLYSEMLCS